MKAEFNLKKAKIYKAVLFQKSFPSRYLRLTRISFLLLGLGSLVVYWMFVGFSFNIPGLPFLNNLFGETSFVSDGVSIGFSLGGIVSISPNIFLGLAYIFSPMGLFLSFFELFFNFFLKYPKVFKTNNSAEFLTFHGAVIFSKAFVVSRRLNEKEVSTDSLLLAMADYEHSRYLFARLGIDVDEFKSWLIKSRGISMGSLVSKISFSFTPPILSKSLQELLETVNDLRAQHKNNRTTTADLIVGLFKHNGSFRKLLVEKNLDEDDLNSLALWHESNVAFAENKLRFWRLENLLRTRPIGFGWIYGYPILLSKYSRNLSASFELGAQDLNIVGRDDEIKEIEQVLLKDGKQNILLVGETGIGKKSIVLGLAQKISQGKTNDNLNYRQILEVNMAAATSSSTKKEEVQNTVNSLLIEAAQIGNAVLFIDGLHNFTGAKEGLGRIDITEILLPYLQSSDIRVIATTDPLSFHKYIETRRDVLTTFSKLNVEELPYLGVMSILGDEVLQAEAASDIFFIYEALKTIYEDADKYIHTSPFPDKALNLLSETVSYVKSKNKKIVEAQDVHEVVTRKTNIPLGTIGAEERQKLIQLESEMHKDIIGQELAVRSITQVMQRLRVGLSRKGKPAGVFLFVGPTGVGKTLTAKVLAKVFFGSQDNMIRFDMSEYQSIESIERLLGSIHSDTPGQLISSIRDKPFSVLLLDEFEKAHPDILNVFLRVFDEGSIKDILGRKVSFEQSIIIATSNAGANVIREMIKTGVDPAKEKERLIDIFISEKYFRPELLNRFDEIVIYHPLNREQIRQISQILIQKLQERVRDKGYYFNPTPDVIKYIAEVGFNPQFGARPMARAIQDRLESVIAKKILENKVQKGVEFSISVAEMDKPR